MEAVPLVDLWLPILLSAVFVFVVSSVIHMATPMHKGDMRPLPNEDDVMAAVFEAVTSLVKVPSSPPLLPPPDSPIAATELDGNTEVAQLR